MYIYFITPIIAFSIAQGTKVFLRSLKQKITWRDIFSYPDLPSGHAAVVVAMATILALRLGIDSPIFAATFVYAAIVITDAVGLRNYLGQHGKTLNILVKDLKEDEFLDHSYPKLLEKIGHTPLQVLIGGIIGVTVSVIMHLLF